VDVDPALSRVLCCIRHVPHSTCLLCVNITIENEPVVTSPSPRYTCPREHIFIDLKCQRLRRVCAHTAVSQLCHVTACRGVSFPSYCVDCSRSAAPLPLPSLTSTPFAPLHIGDSAGALEPHPGIMARRTTCKKLTSTVRTSGQAPRTSGDAEHRTRSTTKPKPRTCAVKICRQSVRNLADLGATSRPQVLRTYSSPSGTAYFRRDSARWKGH
jgi:hypothetical protein